VGPPVEGVPSLVDDVIDVIAASRGFPYAGVQLQVIKALLTAVSSNTCVVQGPALMTAVGSIFHIFLDVRRRRAGAAEPTPEAGMHSAGR